MTQPFLGEIRLFAGLFAPLGWLSCEGQQVRIDLYPELYSVIGLTWGGNPDPGGDGSGMEGWYGLPDLRGRVPVHQGTGGDGVAYALGQAGGAETVMLTAAQMTAHTHQMPVPSMAGNSNVPSALALLADAGPAGADLVRPYRPAGGQRVTLNPVSVTPAGGSLPHDNMQPWTGLTFIIAAAGVYPHGWS